MLSSGRKNRIIERVRGVQGRVLQANQIMM